MKGLGIALEDGPRVWILASCMGVLDEEAPGFWLQHGRALAIVAIWGVNKRMEDLCQSLSLSLSLFQISKLFIKAKEHNEIIFLICGYEFLPCPNPTTYIF